MTVSRLANQLQAALRLARIQNSFYAAIYTLVGVYLAGGLAAVAAPKARLAALVVGLIVAYGFVVNDCYDLPGDLLTRPARPLSSGAISLRAAWRIAIALAAAALILAFALSPVLGAVAAGNIMLTTVYSGYLKHTLLLGNMTMSLLNSSIILFGSLAAGTIPLGVLYATVMMFCYILAQEIIYTLEDLDGDRTTGVQTTAVRLGRDATVQLYSIVTLAFVATTFLPVISGIAGRLYLAAVLCCSIIPLLAIMVFVRAAPTYRSFAIAGRSLKALWALGLIPILLLK